MPPLIRQTGPLASLCRIGVLLCGVAFTWLCAAFGMLRFTGHATALPFTTTDDVVRPAEDRATTPSGADKVRLAEDRVIAIAEELITYEVDHHRCPPNRDALIAGGYLSASFLVDPWGRSVTYWCTDEVTVVTSAGPDGLLGTDDDVRSPGPE